MPDRAPRQLALLLGKPEETGAEARGLAGDGPIWVTRRDEPGATLPGRVGALLGTTARVVVIDGHGGLDPEVLGQCQGLVGRGGRLVVRLDPAGSKGAGTRGGADRRALLAPFPFGPEAVGDRMQGRLRSHLEAASKAAPLTMMSDTHGLSGNEDAIAAQEALVGALEAHLRGPGRRHAALIAPRGRGKSATLGRLLGHLLARGVLAPHEVILASADDDGLGTLRAFAAAAGVSAALRTVRPDAVAMARPSAEPGGGPRLIVLDEAARTPVPVLRRIALAHPDANLVFATTTDGYEGTGQGFVLRFLEWLRALPGALSLFHPARPMRWDEGDPIEAAVDAALLLRAAPAPAEAFGPSPRAAEAHHHKVEQAALAKDDALLAEVFGLLRHAHYRTTPRDLELLLDAPNMHVHLLLLHGHVAAVCLAAEEGGLDAPLTDDVMSGRHRLRAHALADNLVAHMGLGDAGPLRMLRSVRIATHPALRRLGLAARLVEAVHRSHTPDLFGTVFGADPGVIAFRRRLGYEVVRVSATRGARTGEPSVVMLRAASPAGAAVMQAARADFVAGWPIRRPLVEADGLPLQPALAGALAPVEPPDAGPLSAAGPILTAYLAGPMTFEQAAPAVVAALEATPDVLNRLSAVDAALLRARALSALSWVETAATAGLPHAGAAMKRMREAVRALVVAVRAGPSD
jgi:tRNA(Met) cytidine acetyltransferase